MLCPLPTLTQGITFSHALEKARDGIICCTAQGRIRIANEKALHWINQYFSYPSWMTADLPHAVLEAMLGEPEGSLDITGARGTLHLHWSPSDVPGFMILLVETPLHSVQEKARHFGLTPREADVAHWLVQGKTSDEMAELLGISCHTARKHVERILAKLQVRTRTAAAAKLHDDA